MKRIKDYVDRMNDELCDAQHYAEEYVWYRAEIVIFCQLTLAFLASL